MTHRISSIPEKCAGFVRSQFAVAIVFATLLSAGLPAAAQQERVLGLDFSAWQGNVAQTTWNNLCTVENRQFVIIRSSRGGTTGYYNQNNAGNTNPPGQNTLSQRYDDPYYIQNINRVTTAGMFAGSYHFSRPDIITNTLNSAGIANTGVDEANHFIQMAGPWMRPGYLMPVHDLEAGDGKRTDSEMAQFTIDFSDRIFQVMGIRPAIYVNGNYAFYILGGAAAAQRNQIAQPAANPPTAVSPANPTLWSARWPNGTNQYTGNINTDEPKNSLSYIYGIWDDYGVTHPWTFWQYTAYGRLPSFNGGASNLDMNVARGGIEFLKDNLIPAVWMNDSSGDWSTLTNWNSGQTPIAPVQGPGQVARVGTLTMPTPRLPGAAGSGVTSGQHDTVILERTNANITVTLSSGTHNLRKLYMREALNITGGSLAINYVPSWDSTTNGAQFSGPVTMSGSASLSVHTLQVDTNRAFTLGGGMLTFNKINLMPHSTTPAKILLSGNVNLNPLSNANAVIVKGTGSGTSGFIDLGGSDRTFTVGNGTNGIDLSIDVPVSNGGLTKAGLGTMRITNANTYASGTTVSAGTLLVNNTTGSGTGSGVVTVSGGVLGGMGIISGAVIVNSGGTISPGTSIGTLTLNSAPMFNGTNFMEINRNGGISLADKIVLTSGTLNYSGTLVVTNIGTNLVGGEIFTNFTANSGSYSGTFANSVLPPLTNGLNWYLGHLTTNGTIKVNRHPIVNTLNVTNNFPGTLQIPIANLVSNGTDADADILSLSGFGVSTNGVTITSDGTFLNYSNSGNVADKFNFIISDGRGGTATNTVSIAPSTIVAGEFTQHPSANGSSVMLHFSGTPGATYYLDRSTNLPTWLPIWTNVAPSSGLFDYTDTFQDLSEPPSSSFYRLHW